MQGHQPLSRSYGLCGTSPDALAAPSSASATASRWMTRTSLVCPMRCERAMACGRSQTSGLRFSLP